MSRGASQRWNPWHALRSRRHIDFHLHEHAAAAGGGIYARRGPHAVIVIDPALSRTDRRAVLAHELVHDERGGGADYRGSPPGWSAVVARDEAAVDRLVAERLVPADELTEVIDQLVDVAGGVTATDIAGVFDVPVAVAEIALRLAVEPGTSTSWRPSLSHGGSSFTPTPRRRRTSTPHD